MCTSCFSKQIFNRLFHDFISRVSSRKCQQKYLQRFLHIKKRMNGIVAKEPRFVAFSNPSTSFGSSTSNQKLPPSKTKNSTKKSSLSSRPFVNIRNSLSAATHERPFKFFVRKQTFTVDSIKLAKLSPIFRLMCFGPEFEHRELSREIVDERSEDIADFLNCIQTPQKITQWNFTTILRLASKYQVRLLRDNCEVYILSTTLNETKPDQVLTLLIAAEQHHLKRIVIEHMILRLANEDSTTFARLKLNRFLSAKLYTAILSTSLNIRQCREFETMNGHVFRMEKQRTILQAAFCEFCRRIEKETAKCSECQKVYCKIHYRQLKCSNNYGKQMLAELRLNCVEMDGYGNGKETDDF